MSQGCFRSVPNSGRCYCGRCCCVKELVRALDEGVQTERYAFGHYLLVQLPLLLALVNAAQRTHHFVANIFVLTIDCAATAAAAFVV